jgi:TRAP-type C4-dicarboxylate transport system substrate-binding protein
MWAIKEAGCRLLIIAEVNFRQLTNSKRPVKTLADLKGLRVRVPRNKLMINAFKGFGVEPVAMAWAEVFTALQQGVLDGQDVSFNIVRSQKFYETQKYATQIGYIAHAGCLVIGEKFFQSLPPEYRQAVVRAGKEAMDWEREYSDKMFEDDVKFLESKGMVMAGQPSDLSEWVKGARKSWPDAYEIIGGGDAKRGQAIVELVGQMKSVLP